MNKLTNENGLYYIGAGLSILAAVISFFGLVHMIANKYEFTQMIIPFIIMVGASFAASYLYNKTA